MTADPKIYCTAPWVGLTVREDGHVRTCCMGNISLGNLNQNSMDEVLASHQLKQIKQQMLAGQPDQENCKSCILEEKHTGFSTLKNHYNKYYPKFDHDHFELQFLDVRWNNSCNLGCVYCNERFSSVWENRLKIKRAPVVKPYQDDLLQWILDRSGEISELMLVGGEPMLMKQNYELLNQLSDQCKLSIITNLSYDLPKLPCTPRLLSRPRQNIRWNISLENTGMKFEYVRNMGKWSQIENNFRYLTQHWPETISINFVYSMFSAFDIMETIRTFHQFGIKKINLFPISVTNRDSSSNNHSMDIFNMPASIRIKAAQELELAREWHHENLHPEDRDFYPIQGIDIIINQLNESENQPSVTLNMFRDQIAWYDQYNNQKFKDLWPDVIDLVEKYL